MGVIVYGCATMSIISCCDTYKSNFIFSIGHLSVVVCELLLHLLWCSGERCLFLIVIIFLVGG